jgi:hypothetical protein
MQQNVCRKAIRNPSLSKSHSYRAVISLQQRVMYQTAKNLAISTYRYFGKIFDI